MEKKYDNSDFEHFIKQNADQYRMFPSEKVWKGINNTLHTRRRWYGIGLALLLLTTATVTGVMLNHSGNKQTASITSPASVSAKINPAQINEPEILVVPEKPRLSVSKKIIAPDKTQNILFPAHTNNTELSKTKTAATTVYEKTENQAEPVVSSAIVPKENSTATPLVRSQPKEWNNKVPTVAIPEQAGFVNTKTTIQDNTIATPENETAPEDNKTAELNRDIYPMTIESVTNAYQFTRSSKKLVWQFYVTPSVTYRKLVENTPFLEAASSSSGLTSLLSFSDVNSRVTHKPDIGIQLGFSAGYPVSKNILLKAGLQFNVSKYNIKVSTHTSEVATFALNTTGGGTNSVSAITNYRNVAGYRSAWLHNKYVSASIPIGAEIKLSGGNSNTIVGIGATVQPTYVLGNRAYLLSTDLKNYAEVPSLTRKLNINTGFEIFAAHTTGNLDWRIGPQVRYQVFSSFVDKYPIKEHLFDFGIKLGVTLK